MGHPTRTQPIPIEERWRVGLVGFCGAGGTGKTTTADLVSDMTGITRIPSSTRSVFKRLGLETEEAQEQLSGAGRISLQLGIQEAFFDSLRGRKEGLTDRTPLDHWCYSLYYCGNWMDDTFSKDMRGRIVKALKRFSHVFYFPLVTFPTQSDGMRKDGFGYRLCYDMLLRQALREFEVNALTVRINVSAQDRAKQIAQYLRSKALSADEGRAKLQE